VKIELSRDWTEFLSALIGRRVRFVLVGGHAVAGHGEPRLTEDLDVFVEPTSANARRLRDALEDFGFGAVASRAKDLLDVALLERSLPPRRPERRKKARG